MVGFPLEDVVRANARHVEVSVRTDRDGHYVTTQIQLSKSGLGNDEGLWGHRGVAERNLQVLNPDGDRNGDLWPLIVESNITPHYPWAVWSRYEGLGYRLVWSLWNGTEWQEIGPVNGRASGDELDPDLAFDPQGRPSLVWSREEGGIHQIYFSRFVKKRFIPAVLVSDPTESGRYPQILSNDGERIVVEYTGIGGTIRRTVVLSQPVTITDDINPVGYDTGTTPVFTGTKNSSEAVIGRRSRPLR